MSESNTVSRSFDVQRRYLKCYTKFQFNGFCFALQGGVNIPHIHVASPLRPKLLETVAIWICMLQNSTIMLHYIATLELPQLWQYTKHLGQKLEVGALSPVETLSRDYSTSLWSFLRLSLSLPPAVLWGYQRWTGSAGILPGSCCRVDTVLSLVDSTSIWAPAVKGERVQCTSHIYIPAVTLCTWLYNIGCVTVQGKSMDSDRLCTLNSLSW